MEAAARTLGTRHGPALEGHVYPDGRCLRPDEAANDQVVGTSGEGGGKEDARRPLPTPKCHKSLRVWGRWCLRVLLSECRGMAWSGREHRWHTGVGGAQEAASCPTPSLLEYGPPHSGWLKVARVSAQSSRQKGPGLTRPWCPPPMVPLSSAQ